MDPFNPNQPPPTRAARQEEPERLPLPWGLALLVFLACLGAGACLNAAWG